MGTLAASAAGQVFYKMALTATKNDNGYVTMFFLLIPALSALISFMLSHWCRRGRSTTGRNRRKAANPDADGGGARLDGFFASRLVKTG